MVAEEVEDDVDELVWVFWVGACVDVTNSVTVDPWGFVEVMVDTTGITDELVVVASVVGSTEDVVGSGVELAVGVVVVVGGREEVVGGMADEVVISELVGRIIEDDVVVGSVIGTEVGLVLAIELDDG